MNITERSAKVLREIDAAIALAEKAKPGPWTAEGNTVWRHDDERESSSICDTVLRAHWADAAFIAASRMLLPTSLRCLKTAVEGLVRAIALLRDEEDVALAMALETDLTTLCDQWEQKK